MKDTHTEIEAQIKGMDTWTSTISAVTKDMLREYAKTLPKHSYPEALCPACSGGPRCTHNPEHRVHIEDLYVRTALITDTEGVATGCEICIAKSLPKHTSYFFADCEVCFPEGDGFTKWSKHTKAREAALR